MGRPPLGAAAMTPAQREARRRATTATRLQEAYAVLVAALNELPATKYRVLQNNHGEIIRRAYAAQRKE